MFYKYNLSLKDTIYLKFTMEKKMLDGVSKLDSLYVNTCMDDAWTDGIILSHDLK